ncbi:hypothetical protein C7S20_13770 [Christiangramia fulva]|uniref:Histidine kinase n=1 Tax=Christiangramia fulva TaxID=2126553 RepID=A0A2R3Z7N1_9FLAO|nr:hypothetical protein [Christiangramia fulva]AVR46242.1 hypothetical protein C7S20_13770 [Christiangramia fulva]
MLRQQEYILNTEEEFQQIESVKDQLKDLHENGNFFHFSLQTLELIRRFNNLYIEYFEKGNESASNFNQLVIISNNLETHLVREN